MQTELSKLLGTEYPIMQGGMAWVAEYHLASAVSEAGGLGIIVQANAPAKWSEIRSEKRRNGQRNLRGQCDADESECGRSGTGDPGGEVPVVITGAGNPEKYMELWKEKNIRVIPVVASAAMAKRMERCGADAVVAEGCESGGHIGESTTMTLVPQVVDAVQTRSPQQEGIADGRGMARR